MNSKAICTVEMMIVRDMSTILALCCHSFTDMSDWKKVGTHNTEAIKLLLCQVKFIISQGLDSNNIYLFLEYILEYKCPLF